MHYVKLSLNPNEEIVGIGHFHWFYTFNAAIWVLLGACGMVATLYIAYYIEVFQTVRSNFQGLPSELWESAWGDTVKRLGGPVDIVSNMHIAIKLGAFGFFVFGLLMFGKQMLIKATTEICLTSDRLVLKRGVISRYVEEMSVDRIEGVDVYQGILGRIMNYGNISVRGMGVGEIRLPIIADPISFRKAIERARSI